MHFIAGELGDDIQVSRNYSHGEWNQRLARRSDFEIPRSRKMRETWATRLDTVRQTMYRDKTSAINFSAYLSIYLSIYTISSISSSTVTLAWAIKLSNCA